MNPVLKKNCIFSLVCVGWWCGSAIYIQFAIHTDQIVLEILIIIFVRANYNLDCI